MSNNKKYRYVTALTNEKYLPGVYALCKALEKVKSNYGLTVIVPEHKTELISKINALLPETFLSVKPIYFLPPENYSPVNNPNWRDTFFKLKCFGLTEYDKVVMLDSDLLILNNIDDLFSFPHGSAVAAGACLSTSYCHLNSGVMVIVPDKKLESTLEQLIPEAIENNKKRNLEAGDQDVIQTYFSDWIDRPELHIDEKYNALWRCLAYLCKKVFAGYSDIKVVHFINPNQKPWNFTIKDLPHMCYVAYKEKSFARLRAYFGFKKYCRKFSKKYKKAVKK